MHLILPKVREAAYRIYLYPDPHQIELLDALLLARHQMAQLVGYPTYAHRELRGTMLEDPGVCHVARRGKV